MNFAQQQKLTPSFHGHQGDMQAMDFNMMNSNNAMMNHIMQANAMGQYQFLPPGYVLHNGLIRPTFPGDPSKVDGTSDGNTASYEMLYSQLDPMRFPQHALDPRTMPFWPPPGMMNDGSNGLMNERNLNIPSQPHNLHSAQQQQQQQSQLQQQSSSLGPVNEWPSMGSLFGVGESMDNIAQCLANYPQPSTDNVAASAGIDGVDGNDGIIDNNNHHNNGGSITNRDTNEPLSSSGKQKMLSSDDIGLPLDETPANAHTSLMGAGRLPFPLKGPIAGFDQSVGVRTILLFPVKSSIN
jgi:hypothetical protein